MTRKVVRGTGITKETVTKWEGDDRLAVIESWMRSIKENGEFGVVSRAAAQKCEEILRGCHKAARESWRAGIPPEPVGEHSPADFAGRIKLHIEMASDCIRAGNADLAARRAWTAGMLWAMAMMKWQWEGHALRGGKVVRGAALGAEKTNARHGPLKVRRLARMAELQLDLGVDSAAAQCEVEGLGSRAAIKRQWNREQQKRDTPAAVPPGRV